MSKTKYIVRFAFTILWLGIAALISPAQADAPSPAGKTGLVLQVTDNDPAVWHVVLNAAKQIPAEVGRDNIEIEIVAFDPGIHMLKLESEVGNRLAEARRSGVDIIACGNTMKGMKLVDKDLHPSARIVKAGAVEMLHKHQAGWAIIRP